MLSGLLLVILAVGGAVCNQYGPHLYPKRGPYFEGWYIRLMDHDTGESYAALFGQVLPRDPSKSVNNTLITILRTDGHNKLQSYDLFPPDDSVIVHVNDDQPVTADPGLFDPADFTWWSEPYGYLNVKPDHARLKFVLGNVSLVADMGAPVPWMYGEDWGPEGWASVLPLPLAWFVYSTASPTTYHFIDRSKGIDIRGKATAHMEKNWGKSFPSAWFWTEGHSQNHTNGITFAMSGGPLDLGPLSVIGHLAGYENKDKNIALNFRPDNSVMKFEPDECNGKLKLTFTSPLKSLEITIQAPGRTFSSALYGPSFHGFRLMCEESFQATAHIKVYKRALSCAGGWKLIDEQVIEHCALEFGGKYMCIPYSYNNE